MDIRTIRPDDDRLALSGVYETSWRWTYRGIVPQAFLDALHWCAGGISSTPREFTRSSPWTAASTQGRRVSGLRASLNTAARAK